MGAYLLLLQAVRSVKRYPDSEELTLISDLLQKDAHILTAYNTVMRRITTFRSTMDRI